MSSSSVIIFSLPRLATWRASQISARALFSVSSTRTLRFLAMMTPSRRCGFAPPAVTAPGGASLLCAHRHNNAASGVGPTDVFAPSFHQLPSPRQHVAARIGLFGSVSDDVGQGRLDQLTRKVGSLARPGLEARPEAMRRYITARAAKQPPQSVRVCGRLGDENDWPSHGQPGRLWCRAVA